MEQADEPDDVRAPIEAIPDEIGHPPERDAPQRVAVVSDQRAPQLRESREPISQGRQLFCEPLHARPLVAFDEKRQLSARVVAEWLRKLDACQRSAQSPLRARVREDALELVPGDGLHLASDVVAEGLVRLLELPALGGRQLALVVHLGQMF